MSLVQLEEYELLGLQIMALYNTGCMARLNCYQCEEKTKLNCDMTDLSGKSVFFSPEFSFELTTCPLNCIPEAITQFIDEYYHYENSGANIGKYEEQNGRFYTASVMYRGYVNKLSVDKMKEPRPEEKNGIGLSEVKKRFLK